MIESFDVLLISRYDLIFFFGAVKTKRISSMKFKDKNDDTDLGKLSNTFGTQNPKNGMTEDQ